MGSRRILLTRPRDRAVAFAATLAPHGWDAAIWPLTEIRPLHPEVATQGAAAVLYTSRAGVEHAPPTVKTMRAFCVGDATAAAARLAGHERVESANGAAGDLIALVRRATTPSDGPLIHLRGRHIAGDVGDRLRSEGYDVRDALVYEATAAETAPPEIAADIEAGAFAAAAFFSPRASEIFAKLASEGWRDGLSVATAFAISENAARPLGDVGFGAVEIASSPTAKALRAAICGAVS